MINKNSIMYSFSTITLAGFLFASTSIPALAALDCSNLKGCDKKFCEIERQLSIAKENGNEPKANGLKRSLKNARKHCTDQALKEDLITKIDEAQKDITEYESNLKEAEQYGKKDKVHKYQLKIKEEKHKIKRLQEELSILN